VGSGTAVGKVWLLADGLETLWEQRRGVGLVDGSFISWARRKASMPGTSLTPAYESNISPMLHTTCHNSSNIPAARMTWSNYMVSYQDDSGQISKVLKVWRIVTSNTSKVYC
jgi:hypothetical protein